MSRKPDPRLSIKYARMDELVDILENHGPMVIEDLLDEMGIDQAKFKMARYSLPGRLALLDRGVVIPRPVHQEGYVYKLAETYRTGVVSEDGEANVQRALTDMAHRQATIWDDINRLLDVLPSHRAITKRVRKLRNSITNVLERIDDMTDSSKMGGATVQVDEWVEHILMDSGIRDTP